MTGSSVVNHGSLGLGQVESCALAAGAPVGWRVLVEGSAARNAAVMHQHHERWAMGIDRMLFSLLYNNI